MASITIRKLNDGVKERLRVRAARHGRSMEAEARSILSLELATEPATGKELYESIRAVAEPSGDIEQVEIPREPMRDPPDISGPASESGERLLTIIDELFGPLAGVDLPETPRELVREPPDFGE